MYLRRNRSWVFLSFTHDFLGSLLEVAFLAYLALHLSRRGALLRTTFGFGGFGDDLARGCGLGSHCSRGSSVLESLS